MKIRLYGMHGSRHALNGSENMAYGNEGPHKALVNRRTEFYTRWIKGEDLKDIVRVISGKYKVKETALYVDWHRRDTWGIVLAEPEEEFVVQDYLQNLREIEKRLWTEAIQSVDSRTRIAALGKLADMQFKRIEANQTLGRVHREPVKVAIEEQIDKLYEAVKKAGVNVVEQEKIMEVLLEFSHSEN